MDGSFDAIVVGLGAMGSATLYGLVKRGVKALGIEMFQPGHDQGSSHGFHRMIRKSSFQEDGYVPLAGRAFGSCLAAAFPAAATGSPRLSAKS